MTVSDEEGARRSEKPVGILPRLNTGMPTVLVVEDDSAVAALLRRQVKALGYSCAVAGTAAETRALLSQSTFELVLLDIRLPDGSGLGLFDSIHALEPDAAVLMVTAVSDTSVTLDCFRRGAYAFIVKPFTFDDLAIQVEGALYRRKLEIENRAYEERLEEVVEERTAELVGALRQLEGHYDSTIRALSVATEARCPGGREHLQRVARTSVILGKALGLERGVLKDLERGALLHDIGMIGVPDKILLKSGPFDDEEWAGVRKHPEIGYEIVRKVRFLKEVARIVKCHHERYDGKGYPVGLKGEKIPLTARVFSVADTLDAMVRKHPYRDPLPFTEARDDIILLAGTQFDPKVVEVFASVEKEVAAEVYDKV